MVAVSPPLVFSTEFDPQTGIAVEVAPGVVRICAPNAGPFTFTGTNTFIVGSGPVAIIDPGPDDAAHLDAILDAVGDREIAAIVLTHTHRDHCELVPRLKTIIGAPVWSGGQRRLAKAGGVFSLGLLERSHHPDPVADRVLSEGEALVFGEVELTVIATPGHCSNHLAFAISGSDAVLVGDHLMGWSSTVVAAPDGNLADYLTSLDKLIALGPKRYIPSHGGQIADGPAFARAIRTHRLMRNTQILNALRPAGISLTALTRKLYPQLQGQVFIGARQTVLAHAHYLEARGDLRLKRGLFGTRLVPNR